MKGSCLLNEKFPDIFDSAFFFVTSGLQLVREPKPWYQNEVNKKGAAYRCCRSLRQCKERALMKARPGVPWERCSVCPSKCCGGVVHSGWIQEEEITVLCRETQKNHKLPLKTLSATIQHLLEPLLCQVRDESMGTREMDTVWFPSIKNWWRWKRKTTNQPDCSTQWCHCS